MRKKTITIAAGLGLAQFALFGSGALAQDTTGTTIKTNSLEQVVVTATRSPKRKAEVGKVVRVITSEQLERSQGRNLPEVLNNVAGITFSGANNAFSNNATSLFLRGATAGNTLILIDGIAVNDAQSISNEYDLKSIAIDQIDRVEIVKGGNSTLYGSDAVAGVINIITKKPSKEALNANVILTAGSYDANKQAIGLDGTVGKTGIAFNYSHTGSKEFSSANDLAGNAGFDKDGFDQHALNFNARQQLSNKFFLNGNVQLSNNNGMSDGGSFVDDKDYTYNRTHFFGGLTAKYALTNGNINLSLGNNSVTNKFLNLPDDGSARQRTDNKGRIWQADLFLNKELASFLDMNAGINHRKSNSDQFSLYQTSGFKSESPLSASKANAEISSLFTSFLLKNMAGFHLEIGGRYNSHSKYGHNFTYTFNPSYVLDSKYKVFVNISSAFKAPTLYQLYSQYGNEELQPEVTQTYDAGFDLDILPGKLNVNATVFQRVTEENVIFFYTDPNTFESSYKNGYKQDDKGFELEVNTRLLKDMKIDLWYSYLKGNGSDQNGQPVENFLRRPNISAGASGGYTFSRYLSLSLIYKYTGKRSDVFFNSSFERMVEKLPGYSLLDLYVQSKATKNFMVFGDFKNIFDKKYTEWIGYNTRGFNFNVGIKYSVL